MSHGEGSTAADNYVANVSRVLMYVHQHILKSKKIAPRHWSELLSGDVGPFFDYLEK